MDIRGGRGATFPAPRSLGICAGLSPRDALSPFPGFPQPAFRNAATHRGLSGILPCAGGVLTSHGQPKSTGLSPRPVLAHGLRRRTSPADAYNYQGTALFDWSPEQCGNLTLAILFDGFTAEKVYDSPLGFARFVDQAAAGIMEFTPSDFPTVQQQLENLGIAGCGHVSASKAAKPYANGFMRCLPL